MALGRSDVGLQQSHGDEDAGIACQDVEAADGFGSGDGGRPIQLAGHVMMDVAGGIAEFAGELLALLVENSGPARNSTSCCERAPLRW